MRFQLVPTPGPLRRDGDRRRSGHTADFRNAASAPPDRERELAEFRSTAERDSALRNQLDPGNLAPVGRLWTRYFPFPLLLLLALAFFAILAVCWSLWEQ